MSMTTTSYRDIYNDHVEIVRPDPSAMRAGSGIESGLEIVSRRLAGLASASLAEHRSPSFLLFSALLEALQRILSGLSKEQHTAGLAAELEALVTTTPSQGMLALAELGLHQTKSSAWEVCYLELEFQLQRRPGASFAAVEAFASSFSRYHQCVVSVLEVPALLREIMALPKTMALR
jgi:hypothetical protein